MVLRQLCRVLSISALASAAIMSVAYCAHAEDEPVTLAPGQTLGPDSKLPLPRFASMGSKETNLRSGPGTRYPILWVYRQPNLPVEIVDEHENWRKVRDPQGDTGWLHRVLLNGIRHAYFRDGLHDARENPEPNAMITFRVQGPANAKILHCIPDWCQVQTHDHQGWVLKSTFFGAYPHEVF